MSASDDTKPTPEDREFTRRAVASGLFEPTVDALPDGVAVPTLELTPPTPEKYAIDRKLGEGGFGRVYLAEDRSLARPVALKFLTHARPADLERFRREARVTARLADPHIVQVYELDENDGTPFIAMQYIDGEPLRPGRPFAEILTAMLDVARALHRVHGEGIVHRDLKPANILVDTQGRAYLTDFGIARELFPDGPGTISAEGFVLGTPALMPPEQARGEHHAIDARSDVYAFGATLYCLLTGRPPFHASNVVDLLHAVIHDPPPLPRSIAHHIPRPIEDIIVRCLAKDRRARYPSMAPLIEELEAAREGRDDSGGSVWFRRLVGAPAAGATPHPADASSEPEFGVALEIARDLSAWKVDLYRVRSSLAPAHRKLDQILARLDTLLAERPDSAWARFQRGVALFRRGRLDEAREEMERSFDRVADRGEASFELGQLYLDIYLREHQAAQRHIVEEGTRHHLRGARGILEKAVIAFDEARRWQADLPQWQVDYARAVTRLAAEEPGKCAEICERILEDDPDREQVWRLHAESSALAGADPRRSFERAIDIRHSDTDARIGLANAHFQSGAFDAGREQLRVALEIDSELGDARAALIRSYLLEARNGDATLIEEGLRRAREQGELDHYELAATTAELATEHGCRTGDESSFDEALARVEKARELPGCQNRVNLLEARARIERAKLRRARGQSWREDLQLVHRFESMLSTRAGPGSAWRQVLDEAQRLETSEYR